MTEDVRYCPVCACKTWHVDGVCEWSDAHPASFTCPRCGMVSHNPNDAKHRYCGNCHLFFDRVGRVEF